MNMGFAYSQLKDMNNAGTCFLHAFQAAKDSGEFEITRLYIIDLSRVCKHNHYFCSIMIISGYSDIKVFHSLSLFKRLRWSAAARSCLVY